METGANKITNLFTGVPEERDTIKWLDIGGQQVQIRRRLDTSGGQHSLVYQAPSISSVFYWNPETLYTKVAQKLNRYTRDSIIVGKHVKEIEIIWED
jgi:hypothetical protein